MPDILEKIELDLADVEEALLNELRRIRKQHSGETYATLDDSLKIQVELTVDSLREALDHSGDAGSLSLKTEKHENLETRMDVVGRLLNRKIPTVFIESSHKEVKASREQLAARVAQSRETSVTPETGAQSGKKGLWQRMFSRARTDGETARNPSDITRDEEKQFDADDSYQDSGVFSASRELAVLCEQVLLHVDEGQSIEQVVKDRAEFKSRELSTEELLIRDIAQSPDAIRRKLERRGTTHKSGSSTFEARDITPVAEPEAPRKPEPKREIARSPEEIRRKLESRQDSGASAKAVFGAKELSTPPPPSMPEPPPREPEPEPEPEPEVPAGKAVFGSRDIEPEFERFEQARERAEQRKKEKEEAARSSKAVFQSRDLSDPKPD